MDVGAIVVGLVIAIAGGLVFKSIWWAGVLMVLVGLAVIVFGFFESSR